jgi:fucose 4-O-acetylase-like acetyltransferase
VALANEPLRRFRWALLAGAIFAGLAPVMTALDTSGVPWFLRGYLVPGVSFSIFPWGSFMAFGLAAGSMIPSLRSAGQDTWNRVLQWAALCGFALILLGLYCSQLPFSIYEHAEFWIDSPALIACKMGATLLMASGAFLWTSYLNPGPSFVQLLGRNSLIVYWVHIELVYGNLLWFWKESLQPWQSALAASGVIALMVAMCWTLARYRVWQRFGEARDQVSSVMLGGFGLMGRRSRTVLTGLGLTTVILLTWFVGR